MALVRGIFALMPHIPKLFRSHKSKAVEKASDAKASPKLLPDGADERTKANDAVEVQQTEPIQPASILLEPAQSAPLAADNAQAKTTECFPTKKDPVVANSALTGL